MKLSFKSKPRDIAKKQYLELLKLVPGLAERSREYATLFLTFITLIFFSVFAINPTLTTITRLRKELEDSKFVEQALRTKIASFRSLNNMYAQLTPDLPFIFAAIPQSADPATLTGKIQAIAQEQSVTISQLQVQQVELTKPTNQGEGKNPGSSFVVSFNARGSNAGIRSFLKTLASFDRLVNIESLSYQESLEAPLVDISVQIRSYFMR